MPRLKAPTHSPLSSPGPQAAPSPLPSAPATRAASAALPLPAKPKYQDQDDDDEFDDEFDDERDDRTCMPVPQHPPPPPPPPPQQQQQQLALEPGQLARPEHHDDAIPPATSPRPRHSVIITNQANQPYASVSSEHDGRGCVAPVPEAREAAADVAPNTPLLRAQQFARACVSAPASETAATATATATATAMSTPRRARVSPSYMLRLEQRHACASENKRRQKGQAPTTADLECEPSPGAQQQRQQPGRNGKSSKSSGRCASRIRSRRRRMASVPGQTELMRLRTAGAAATSPKKATSNVVEPGNDAQGTQSKDRLLLTPLRVRAAVSAYPLRVRQKSGSGSPTWRESEKGHGSKDIPSRLQDKGRVVMDILEAAQGSSLSRKRRATEDEEVEPESPSKRSRHREVSLSPSNPFSDLRLPTTSTPAHSMNFFAASTSSDGVFQLTRLPRVGTPGTPERRLQNRLCAPTPTCISAVGNLPEFPVGYYFGALEGAIEGLAPFLGVGGRGRQAARASTKESVVKRSVPGVFENAGEDGGEHRGSVEK